MNDKWFTVFFFTLNFLFTKKDNTIFAPSLNLYIPFLLTFSLLFARSYLNKLIIYKYLRFFLFCKKIYYECFISEASITTMIDTLKEDFIRVTFETTKTNEITESIRIWSGEEKCTSDWNIYIMVRTPSSIRLLDCQLRK